MGQEHRRVAAESQANAQAVAQNLVNQGYTIESTTPTAWTLRRKRMRGDIVVTVLIARPLMPGAPLPPPTGPPAG